MTIDPSLNDIILDLTSFFNIPKTLKVKIEPEHHHRLSYMHDRIISDNDPTFFSALTENLIQDEASRTIDDSLEDKERETTITEEIKKIKHSLQTTRYDDLSLSVKRLLFPQKKYILTKKPLSPTPLIKAAIFFTALMQFARLLWGTEAALEISGLTIPFSPIKNIFQEIAALIESTTVFVGYQIGINTGINMIIWTGIQYALLFCADACHQIAKRIRKMTFTILDTVTHLFNSMFDALLGIARKIKPSTLTDTSRHPVRSYSAETISIKTFLNKINASDFLEDIDKTFAPYQRMYVTRKPGNIEWKEKLHELSNIKNFNTAHQKRYCLKDLYHILDTLSKTNQTNKEKYDQYRLDLLNIFASTRILLRPPSPEAKEITYTIRLFYKKVSWGEWAKNQINIPTEKECNTTFKFATGLFVLGRFFFFDLTSRSPVEKILIGLPHLIMKFMRIDTAHQSTAEGTYIGHFYTNYFFDYFQYFNTTLHCYLLAHPVASYLHNGTPKPEEYGKELANNAHFLYEESVGKMVNYAQRYTPEWPRSLLKKGDKNPHVRER